MPSHDRASSTIRALNPFRTAYHTTVSAEGMNGKPRKCTILSNLSAGIAPLVAARINLERIARLRRVGQAKGKFERVAAVCRTVLLQPRCARPQT
ncbi:hypothetical protein [Neisseria gonorrhoeae]